MSIRASFVEHFGEDQASAIETAAMQHMNGIHDNPGSDRFRWAIAICLGYECMEIDRYRESHGITTPWNELDAWIMDNANLKEHDGDCDYLALFCGAYDKYVKEAS